MGVRGNEGESKRTFKVHTVQPRKPKRMVYDDDDKGGTGDIVAWLGTMNAKRRKDRMRRESKPRSARTMVILERSLSKKCQVTKGTRKKPRNRNQKR